MTGILTTFAFLVLGALLVTWHLRRSGGSDSGAACGHCTRPLPAGATHCPHCHVPQQVFELATAARVTEEDEAADGGKLHAAVKADVCVGCAACIPVCPESGAIRMEGKIAIVDRSKCEGHASCVDACPVGGIFMTTGAMVQRVDVPDIGSDFQSNVPGVYIVGELGGRGLIKNAINEGRIAVERVAADLKAAGINPHPEACDLAIVGSGPAGLSAALEARRAGLNFTILEQGDLADSIRRYPRHKLLLAEPVNIPLYGELWVADAEKETLLRIWERMVETQDIEIRTGCRVETVERDGDLLHARGAGFDVSARRVILAMGRRGTPRRLGVPGEDLPKVFYDIAEMSEFAGRHVLVVGGGDSALESAVGLSNQPGTTVTLSYRKSTFDRAKERNVGKLAEAEQAGRVRVLRNSEVRRIGRTEVVLEAGGEAMLLQNDDVVVRIGGEPPTRFLAKVGVRNVKKELRIQETETVGS